MSFKDQGMNWIRFNTRLLYYHDDAITFEPFDDWKPAFLAGERTTICCYCGAAITKKDCSLDHISNQRINKRWNITTCCKSCNSSKKSKPVLQWLDLQVQKGMITQKQKENAIYRLNWHSITHNAPTYAFDEVVDA